MITLTYQASEKAEASYGLMGVSKSALESAVRYLALELGTQEDPGERAFAGPIETVAATGIMGAFLRNPEALETAARAGFPAGHPTGASREASGPLGCRQRGLEAFPGSLRASVAR